MVPPKRKTFSRSEKSVVTYGSRRSKKAPVKRRINYLYKLKACIRMVVANIMWLADSTNRELGTNPEVNAFIIRHRRTKKQFISLEDKICLKQPLSERDPTTVLEIARNLALFKSFQGFSEELRRDIVSKCYFNAWPKGRTIVRQGHVANYVYYITEGIVESVQEYSDPLFPKETFRNVDKYHEGDNFGSQAVFYNEPHYGTITVVSEYVEVIMLDKDNFIKLLKSTIHRQWTQVRWALSKFPHFDHFSEQNIRKFCSFSTLVTYPPETIVPMKDNTDNDVATFLVDGTLTVVQHLYIREDKTKTIPELRYKLCKKPEGKNLPEDIKQIVMETCTLKRKCVVGLGEKMSENTIICDSEALVLIIPRFLLIRYNPNNMWERVVSSMDMAYPTEQDIFNSFIEEKKWFKYKRELLKTTQIGKKNIETTIHDVPLLIRARNLRIRGELYKKVTSMPLYKLGELDVDENLATLRRFRDKMKAKLASMQNTEIRENFEEQIDIIKEEYRSLKNDGLSRKLSKKFLQDLKTVSKE